MKGNVWKKLEQFPWVEMVTILFICSATTLPPFPPTILRDLILTVRDKGLAFLVCEEDLLTSLKGCWSMWLDISSFANQFNTESKVRVEIFPVMFLVGLC